jgi:hypothetical protein
VAVPGVPGDGHLLSACSEKERGQWLQDIQMGIQTAQDLYRKEQYEEERKSRLEDDFKKLNMIDLTSEAIVSPLV